MKNETKRIQIPEGSFGVDCGECCYLDTQNPCSDGTYKCKKYGSYKRIDDSDAYGCQYFVSRR